MNIKFKEHKSLDNNKNTLEHRFSNNSHSNFKNEISFQSENVKEEKDVSLKTKINEKLKINKLQ